MKAIRSAIIAAAIGGLCVFAWGGTATAAETSESGVEIGHHEEEAIHCLEEGNSIDRCMEAPNPILPDESEVIWGGAAFLVLLGVMYKFAYPAIKKGMEARTEKIRNDIDEAERTRTEASEILSQYQAQLADAKAEANRIIEEARQSAESVRADLINRAESEAAELRNRNQAEIDAARDRTMADLREEVASLAIDLAEKVVEKNLDDKTNKALIDSYIQQVGAR